MPLCEAQVTTVRFYPFAAIHLPALAVMVGLLGVSSANGQSDLCETAVRVASAETGVPLPVLRAITLVETGRTLAGRPQPWPWAVNHAGTSHWFPTRKAAVDFAAQALAEGSGNLDIGCFQMNHRWHGAKFSSLDQMFDPVENARQAARFLQQLHRNSGDWAQTAGRYHSRTPHLAERYRARFATQLAAADQPDLPAPERRTANGFPLLRPSKGGALGSLVPADASGRRLLPGSGTPLIGG